MNSKSRPSLFARLQKGLVESIRHEKGELTLKTVEVPLEPPQIDATTLAELRTRAAMSQAVFARMLNVSPRTLQSWEQGVREPSDASRRLLQIFSEHPEVVCESAGLPPVKLEGVVVKVNGDGVRRIVVEPSSKRRRAKPQVQS